VIVLPAAIPGLIGIFPAPVLSSDLTEDDPMHVKRPGVAVHIYEDILNNNVQTWEVHRQGFKGPTARTAERLWLDLSNPIGRFIAASWLLERGYDYVWALHHQHGAKVLRCSVMRVNAGLPPAVIVGPWWCGVRGDMAKTWALVGGKRFQWHAGKHGGENSSLEAARKSADDCLLSQGYVLTNDDGTITLPPEGPQ
jgi:hypothetical protein